MLFTAIAVIALVGAVQTPDSGRAQTISIELSNFRFTPTNVVLDHGAPYRIHPHLVAA